MVSTRSTKRPLAEIDSNVPRRKSKLAKQTEKSKDDKKLSSKVVTYARMERDQLAQLCRDRNLHCGGGKIDLIEALEKANQKGEPETDTIARIEEARATFRELENVAREQLTRELKRPVAPKDPRVVNRAIAIRMNERAKVGHESYTDTSRMHLAEAAKLRRLPCDGTRRELETILQADDNKDHKTSITYIEGTIKDTFEWSPAYVRAIEIMMPHELDRLNHDTELPFSDSDTSTEAKAARTLQQLESKRIAAGKARPIIEQLAYSMVADGDKVNTSAIGARFLHRLLLDYVSSGGAGGYTKLHVGELEELLRLRGEERSGKKPKLIEYLNESDYKNYGAPKPAVPVLRETTSSPGFRKSLGLPPLVTTHSAEVGDGEVMPAVLKQSTPAELHMRAHEALEREHEVNLPCDCQTVASRVEADKINADFGDQPIKVKRLHRRVVEELCKVRGIYIVTTEEDLRRRLSRDLKEANLKSEVFLEQMIKEVECSAIGLNAMMITKRLDFEHSMADLKLPHNDHFRDKLRKFAGENAEEFIEEQIKMLAAEYLTRLDDLKFQDIDFDKDFFGARLLCCRIKRFVEWNHSYKKFTKGEVAAILRVRGIDPALKSKDDIIAMLTELDAEENFGMPGW